MGESIQAPNARRVRIQDVAEYLGLQKSTVSRALNGYPDIALRTQRRVAHAAKEMGYIPLAAAQAIRTGRARTVGLILEHDTHDGFGPFLRHFLSGITEASGEAGWSLTVSSAHYGPDFNAKAQELVRENKADGFILPRTRVDDARVKFLTSEKIPFVLFGRTMYDKMHPDSVPYPYYDIRGDQALKKAVLRLYALGHRCIGFVGCKPQFQFSSIRFEGYRAGLAAVELDFDPALVRTGAFTTADGIKATQSLLFMPNPPTAIVFATDEIALGAYHVAYRYGLTIGRDLSVIAYDGISQGRYAFPPLTSFHVDTKRAGRQLCALLIARINGAAFEDLQILENAVLHAGGSDGPPAMESAALGARFSGLQPFE